jgi:hypothetical protein
VRCRSFNVISGRDHYAYVVVLVPRKVCLGSESMEFASGASLQSSDTRKLFAVDMPVEKPGLYS